MRCLNKQNSDKFFVMFGTTYQPSTLTNCAEEKQWGMSKYFIDICGETNHLHLTYPLQTPGEV